MATTLPPIVSQADIETLASMHGGHAQQFAKPQSNADLANGTPEEVVFVFKDGTSFTASWNQSGGGWSVSDWGSVGDQAKQTATKTLTPEEQRIQAQTIQSNDLSIQKQQQDLQPKPAAPGPMQSAISDYQDAVAYIEQQIRTGQMTYSEGQSYIKGLQGTLQSQFTGATPYQQSQADRTYQQNNAQMGAGLLNQRVSSGSSVLNQLLGDTQSAMSKMLPGTGFDPHTWNPYAMAKSFTTDLGGGQQTYDLAQSMLQGAMAPVGPDPASPAYWMGTPENPGDAGLPQGLDEDTLSQLIGPSYGAGLVPSGSGGGY